MDRNQLEEEYHKLLNVVLDQINMKQKSGELSVTDAEVLRNMFVTGMPRQATDQYHWDNSDYWESSSTVC